MTERRPNIYDVAKLAGVSHQTVSRVINDQPNIRESTRASVLKAMAELGYVPSHAARSLVTARTHMIGILASDTFLYGPSSALHAIEFEARHAGYVAITTAIDVQSDESIRDGVQHLRRLGIEGLVVITPQIRSAVIEKEIKGTIPIVAIGSMYRPDQLSVSVDGFKGAVKATQHLIDLGHKEILHIIGQRTSFDAQQRLAGYSATMLAAGLQPQTVAGDWEIETGYQLGLTTDFDANGTTAVFAANDQLAIGLLKACRERGIKVPQRLSVVGYDDLPEAAYLDPPLTTLRQDFRSLGEHAVRLLLGLLNGETGLTSQLLDPEFRLRESTAPPPQL